MWSSYELGSSKPPPKTEGVSVGADEKDKQITELKERMHLGDPGADLTRIQNGDRRYRYRGINKKPERIARAKAKGFEEVPASDPACFPVKMGISGKEFGDLVLMREPVELHQHKVKTIKDRGDEATRRFQEEQREKINRIAREAGAVGPHKEAAFEESKEE